MSDELCIETVTLVNYRQYHGTVKVDFSTSKNAFSVIVGANGAGKSNLWNAIHWCLFGTEPHIKSSNVPTIISKNCLSEPEGKKITMSVELIMSIKNVKYKIRRQIEGLLGNLQYENGMLAMSTVDPVPSGFEVIHRDNAKLFQISRNGGRWATESDKHDFKSLVEQYIIPENLSQFFILDGEFLQELFDKFKDIQSGIDQISQINALNDAITYAENVPFQRVKGTGKIAEIQDSIKRHEQYLASEDGRGVKQTSSTEMVYGTDEPMHATGTPRKKDLDRSIKNMDAELQKLNKEISDSDALVKIELAKQHESDVELKKDLVDRLGKLRKYHINLLVTKGPFIMCKRQVETATKLIGDEMEQGKLPNRSKRMLVDSLLSRQACICGTSLQEGTDARKFVEDEKTRITDEVQYDITNDIKYNNDQFYNNYDKTVDSIDDGMTDIEKMRRRLKKLDEKIRTQARNLPKYDVDFSELISSRSTLSAQMQECLKELGSEENEIMRHANAKGDDLRRMRRINVTEDEAKRAILIGEKSEAVRVKLRDIRDDVNKTVRNRVSRETLKIFNSLSWKNYGHLRIDEKYRINITGNDKLDISGGMAAGEKLFLALSFIMALKRITNYKFPFVIDSPLGKTGGKLRILFGKHMPELLDGSQLIMLATNTEWDGRAIQPEDGGKASHTLKELFEEKVKVEEYEIDFNQTDDTAKIVKARWTTR